MPKRTTLTFRAIKPVNSRFQDLTGKRFGRLTVIRLLGRAEGSPSRYPAIHWECRCDCGNMFNANGGTLRSGRCKSCGCLCVDASRSKATIHGRSKTPEYIAYNEAKKRCTYAKHNRYARYGGRGIEFRFTSFDEFYEVLGDKPTRFHSLDRIDVNGHYEPGNVRWATNREQSVNRSDNHLITINGVTRTMTDWAIERGLDARTIDTRMRVLKFCEACAVLLPKFQSCPHRN